MRTYQVEVTVDGTRTIITVEAYSSIDAQTIVKKMFYGSNVTVWNVR